MINTIEQAGGKEWVYSHNGACRCNRGWDDVECNRLPLNDKGLCEDCHAEIVAELSADEDDTRSYEERVMGVPASVVKWAGSKAAMSYVLGVKVGNA